MFSGGKTLLIRFGCVFRLKSHEITRKTQGFSFSETGENLKNTSQKVVFDVIFSADSSKNTIFLIKVALKLEFWGSQGPKVP